MPTFDKKTVYHSQLSAASPLRVMLTSDVKPSKFAGKPPWVAFKVDGDPGEYQYTVENDACGAALSGLPRNVWFLLTAAGSRESATIHASGVEGASAPRSQPAPAQDAESIASAFYGALEIAARVVARFEKAHGRHPSETERVIATTFFIEHNRTGRPIASAVREAPKPAPSALPPSPTYETYVAPPLEEDDELPF